MNELFKVSVQKFVKAPSNSVYVLVKTYEVREHGLRMLAIDPTQGPKRLDGSPGNHRITMGPLSTDKHLEVVSVEWQGRPGQSNVAVGIRPEEPGEGLKLCLEEHAAQGWQVPELQPGDA